MSFPFHTSYFSCTCNQPKVVRLCRADLRLFAEAMTGTIRYYKTMQMNEEGSEWIPLL